MASRKLKQSEFEALLPSRNRIPPEQNHGNDCREAHHLFGNQNTKTRCRYQSCFQNFSFWPPGETVRGPLRSAKRILKPGSRPGSRSEATSRKSGAPDETLFEEEIYITIRSRYPSTVDNEPAPISWLAVRLKFDEHVRTSEFKQKSELDSARAEVPFSSKCLAVCHVCAVHKDLVLNRRAKAE